VDEAKTYHSEDDKSWATIIPSWGVTLFSYGSTEIEADKVPFAVAEKCEKLDDNTYRVKLFKKYYIIKIVGDYITVEIENGEE
jgi:hypothetical protein